MMQALLTQERTAFHKALLDTILTVDAGGVPSNADRSNRLSIALAQGVRSRLIAEVNQQAGTVSEDSSTYRVSREKAKGQSSGKIFEQQVSAFLAATFPHLQHLRPGTWHILQLGNQNQIKTYDFAQYEHLEYLTQTSHMGNSLCAL